MNPKANQPVGRIDYETRGAEYLCGLGFSETVCGLAEIHVPAKRCGDSRLPLHCHSKSKSHNGRAEHRRYLTAMDIAGIWREK